MVPLTRSQNPTFSTSQTFFSFHGMCCAYCSPTTQTCQLPGCPIDVYVDNLSNRVYDHCCKDHAIRHMSGQGADGSSVVIETSLGEFQQECLLPGCTRMGTLDTATGQAFDYCSRDHANQARARGGAAAATVGLPQQQSINTTHQLGATGTANTPAAAAGGVTLQITECAHPRCTRPCDVHARTSVMGNFCRHHSFPANPSGTQTTTSFAAPPIGRVRLMTNQVCSGAAPALSTQPVPQPSLWNGQHQHKHQQPSRIAPPGECMLDGCSTPCAVDRVTGVEYDHCSKPHALKAKEREVEAQRRSMLLVARSGNTVMVARVAAAGGRGGTHAPKCHLIGCNRPGWYDDRKREVSQMLVALIHGRAVVFCVSRGTI